MAGVSTKEIKTRIRSMESTKQITKAMEMVASSKLRHAQTRVSNSRPYFEILYSTITDIVRCNTDLSSPYLTVRPVKKTAFVVIAGETPETLRLLPLTYPTGNPQNSDILYEPGSVEVFDAIVPEYLGGILYGALCESRAAEQAARRSAMDSATQNAEAMIADLSLKFNQARQAAITQEITEIVAGSNSTL